MLYYFPGDHCVLQHSRPRAPRVLPDEQREEWFTTLAAMRSDLASLTGDSGEMEMLLRVFDGELSCRDLAKCLGVDASSAWRMVQRRLQECRFNRAAGLAADRFQAGRNFIIDVRRGCYTPKTSNRLVSLTGGRFSSPTLPSAQQIMTYLRKNARLLNSPKMPDS